VHMFKVPFRGESAVDSLRGRGHALRLFDGVLHEHRNLVPFALFHQQRRRRGEAELGVELHGDCVGGAAAVAERRRVDVVDARHGRQVDGARVA